MEGILGQQRATDILQSGLATDRLHHAYIFHGPRGVGKFTTARVFAKVLLCPHAQADLAGNFAPCGSCESCRLMAPTAKPDKDFPFDNEAHPDYHVIRKELAGVSSVSTIRTRKQMNIPLDVLRERMIGGRTSDGKFHDAAAFKTAQLGHRKVFIIDEAELLDRYGQNALLKTLEEPPSGTFIILVTSSEDKLLPTIRSRCQRVTFCPLPDDVMAQWLDDHAAAVTGRRREWLIQFAGGSPGLAALAIEYDLFEWARVVLPAVKDMMRGEYPTSLGGDMAGLIGEFAEAWVKPRKHASKDAANRLAAGLMWTLISQYARRRLAAAAADVPAGDLLAGEATLEPWAGVADAIVEAETNLARNVNLTLVVEALVSAMYRTLAPAPAR